MTDPHHLKGIFPQKSFPALLSDGKTELSISYHRDLFGIYIHLTP